MIIINGTLFAHPKIFNPLPTAIDAYWWTNVGQQFTAANQNCKPSAGNPGSRILSPAAYTVNNGAVGNLR